MAAATQGLKTFTYTALSPDGSRIVERMQAESPDEVQAALHRASYTPIDISEVKAVSLNSSMGELLKVGSAPKMKVAELSQFTRQLHQLLKAGIPVGGAVAILAESQKKPAIADILKTVSERIVNGERLSNAFAGWPKVFNEVFIAYMASGEQSGDLVDVTSRLAAILDKRAEIQRKVKAVSMYPMLVMGAIVAMLTGIILFIVPRYAEIYESLDAPLPAPTQAVVTLSRIFPIVAIAITAFVFGFVSWNKTQKNNLDVGEKLDRVRFKMPIFGSLFHKMTLFRFISTFGGALAAGVQNHDALDLSGRASASRWVRKTVPELQEAVQSGRPVSDGFAIYSDLFPVIVRNMVQTGETTGDLPSMLTSVGSTLEDEIDLTISTMSAKIEVAMLMFMGVTVGGILAALYLPIIRLSTTLGSKYGF